MATPTYNISSFYKCYVLCKPWLHLHTISPPSKDAMFCVSNGYTYIQYLFLLKTPCSVLAMATLTYNISLTQMCLNIPCKLRNGGLVVPVWSSHTGYLR